MKGFSLTKGFSEAVTQPSLSHGNTAEGQQHGTPGWCVLAGGSDNPSTVAPNTGRAVSGADITGEF